MTARAMTVPAAARELGVSQSTVRRWIRESDAPVVMQGGPGRGKGARVDVDEMRRWRAGDDATRILERIAGALLDTLLRDCGGGWPAHEALGFPRAAAAAYLLEALKRIKRTIPACDVRIDAEAQLMRIAEPKPSEKRTVW